jgi:electron transfer flavoprotein alpha subunit
MKTGSTDQVSGGLGIWVLAEQSGGKLNDASLEVLSCARQLADKSGGKVSAALFGNSQELARALGSYGADKVYLLDNPLLLDYSPEPYVEALSRLIKEGNPAAVLGGATLTGREFASRLAARLNTGLLSDCVSLTVNQQGLMSGTRLTHGGRVSSTTVCPSTRPQMATVRSGIMKVSRPDTTRKPEVTVITPELSRSRPRVKVTGVVRADPEKIGLDEAEVIVAGGRGVGNKENFGVLEDLARRLGGVVAGSLGAIDEGWLPRRKLVGQTGTTVAPKLYIACGISGSVYHVLGMREAEFVIAINKDPGAPIFKVADMGIIGDVVEVLTAIIGRLSK